MLMISPGSEFLLWPEQRQLLLGLRGAPDQEPAGGCQNQIPTKTRAKAAFHREPLSRGGPQRRAAPLCQITRSGMIAASDKRQWGMESAKAGSARDSTVAAGCRLGLVDRGAGAEARGSSLPSLSSSAPWARSGGRLNGVAGAGRHPDNSASLARP
jgi:hypothetical protein